jgi:hypothetical protein
VTHKASTVVLYFLWSLAVLLAVSLVLQVECFAWASNSLKKNPVVTEINGIGNGYIMFLFKGEIENSMTC